MRALSPSCWTVSAFVLALVLGACGSTPAAGDLPTDPVEREKVLGERLTLRDPQIGAERGASFLEVTIANAGGSRIATRCAPEWYDAKGAVVAAASAWQDVQLEPGQEQRLRFAPMPPGARSWRLRFAP